MFLADRFGLGPDDVVYLSMPLFHSNAVMAGWALALASAPRWRWRRRFSASGFLPTCGGTARRTPTTSASH